MSPRTARALTQMLRDCRHPGNRHRRQPGRTPDRRQDGHRPRERVSSRETVVSFIAFAPADRPTVAVAVLLRDPHGGFGGTVAAPIAAHVIRALLTPPRS